MRHRPSFIARIAFALPPDIFGPEDTWGASRRGDFARSLATAPSGSSLLQRCHPKTGGRPAKETCLHFCSPNLFLGGPPSQASGAQRGQAHRPQNQLGDQCSWLPGAACCVMSSRTAVSRCPRRRRDSRGSRGCPRARRERRAASAEAAVGPATGKGEAASAEAAEAAPEPAAKARPLRPRPPSGPPPLKALREAEAEELLELHSAWESARPQRGEAFARSSANKLSGGRTHRPSTEGSCGLELVLRRLMNTLLTKSKRERCRETI